MVQFSKYKPSSLKRSSILKPIGKITQLFISKQGHSSRIRKKTLSLNTLGIKEDKFYNKDTQRSILMTSQDSYTLMEQHNITVPYGTLGENILIDFNPYHLKPGTQFKVGENVLLEISQYCTICNHLSAIDQHLPKLLKNDRGIFAKVLKEGVIAQGDNIYML